MWKRQLSDFDFGALKRLGIQDGHQHAFVAFGPSAPGDGQNAFDVAHAAGKRQLAHQDIIVKQIGTHLIAGRQHAHGDGQIETGAFNATLRVFRPAIRDALPRAATCLAGFFSLSR